MVGSKNFGESRLLGEIFAQVLEADTDRTVERRLGLAGTTICFEALRNGEIDLYPEYTGTGLVTILGMPAEGDPAAVLARVRGEFRARYDLEWLAPLGFQNAYEVAVRSDVARRLGLRTISDLAPHAHGLTAGFGYEFTEREDGLKGLSRVYGLRFGDVLNMQQNVKYRAAGAGRLDVLDVYTTDGQILVHDLTVLEDDRGHFPPYQAAALVNGKTLRRHPEVAALFLYSLYPILRNTFTGVRDADPSAVAAALACGMNPRQVLWRVRLPLAAPVIMAGVRTAAVINVGTATLAAFIGAGGLGVPIVRGLQLAETKVILSGALPAALLAVLLDGLLTLVERAVRPRGV